MNVFIMMLAVLAAVAILAAYSKAHIVLKSVLIPVIIFSSILSFLTLLEYQGKPILITHIPPEVTVYGQVVDKEKELIYMLFTEKDELPPADYYKTVYNEKLAKALAEGQKGKKGKPFKLKSKEAGKEGDGGDGKGKKKGKKGGSLSLESASFSVHDLPPLKMPEKG